MKYLIFTMILFIVGCGTTKKLMKNCDKVEAQGSFWVCEKAD